MKDRLILGPIDKYKRYALFPWKFILHITLLFLTAAQVLVQIADQVDYQEETQYLIRQLFLTTAGDVGKFPPQEMGVPITLYDINELVEFIGRTRDNYYNITGSDMLDQVLQERNTTTGEIVPIQGYIFEHRDSKISQEFTCNSTSLGPFD